MNSISGIKRTRKNYNNKNNNNKNNNNNNNKNNNNKNNNNSSTPIENVIALLKKGDKLTPPNNPVGLASHYDEQIDYFSRADKILHDRIDYLSKSRDDLVNQGFPLYGGKLYTIRRLKNTRKNRK